MAVALEFAKVIALRSAVERSFTGGLDGLAAMVPNFIEDEALLRIGFMSNGEADALIGKLEAAGVRADEVALVSLHDTQFPAWLEVGVIENVAACWLRDAPRGALVPLDTPLFVLVPRRAWTCRRAVSSKVVYAIMRRSWYGSSRTSRATLSSSSRTES